MRTLGTSDDNNHVYTRQGHGLALHLSVVGGA